MIERAIEIATTEIEIIEDEQQALKRFSSRLRSIDSSHLSSSSNSNPAQNSVLSIEKCHQSVSSHGQTSTQKEVIDAYRETVVQMDHYEEEYGNSIPEDVALELGEQAARLIFLKSHLTATDIRNLIVQTEESLKERDHHARGLDQELNSLEQCDAELSDIETRFFDLSDPTESSFDGILSLRDDLCELEHCCQTLLTRRQDTIHSRMNAGLRGVDKQSLNQYLYGKNHSVTCPVLHDSLVLSQHLRTERERCERLLSNVENAGARSTSVLNG